MERLQKVIASSGYCSRRKAEELIINGKVIVNGDVVTELGTKVDSKDIIIVEGHSISYEEKEYYMLKKPREVISSILPSADKLLLSIKTTKLPSLYFTAFIAASQTDPSACSPSPIKT